MAIEAHDLTDTWYGRFSYPRRYGPVQFTAELKQIGTRLLGRVEEPARQRSSAGVVLNSTVFGTVSSGGVHFVKRYDGSPRGHRAVQYVGTVADDGLEIHGEWSIPGNWSGTFIMIRSRGLGIAASNRQKQDA